MRCTWLVVLAGVCLSIPARADPCCCDPLDGGRWEVGVAFAIVPHLGLDKVDGPSALGAHASLGRQLGHVRLSGEYTFVSFDDPFDGISGQLQRIGLAARYRIGLPVAAAGGTPWSTGFYLEGGVGQQSVAWTGGGSQSRRDLGFGLGYEMASGSRRFGGFDVGVKVLAADSKMDDTLDLTWMIQVGGIVGR